MRLKFLSALTVFVSSVAIAQSPPPPKLLVVISVDQFSADLFDEYRPQFTSGLARIASGAAFRNGYQSHAATETCPGHSTILTGDHPARTGIVANFWTDQSVRRSDQSIYCAEDEHVPGSSSLAYTVSPVHLLVPTLGELMKARWPGSRSVAVSGKDRAAVMMSGHNVDQRWYWTGTKFETDLKGTPVPQVLAKVNSAALAGLNSYREPMQAPPFCQARARPIPVHDRDQNVGNGFLARNAEDQNAFRASPELDGDTLALAAALVDEMQLGRKAAPDVLAVSLSATDYVGHTYGTEGQEMCLQLLELDREIGDFLSALDSRGIDYAVALTADHGGLDIPERKQLAGDGAAARVTPDLAAGAMGLKLVQKLGLSGFGLLGEGTFGDMYVDRNLPPRDRKRLLDAAVAAYRAQPQVEAVFTAEQIENTPLATAPPDKWSLIERVRASHYPGRSGDFYVVLKRDITPIYDTSRYIATHGSAWDYDRRVPILFWRPGMPQMPSDVPTDTVDIAPTLAAMIGMPLASGSVDGTCLQVPGVACQGSAKARPGERGER